jgi:hypothetical protein
VQSRDNAWVTLSQACKIAGVKTSTARYWFGQGYIKWDQKDQPAAKAGATALLSERTVLALAIGTRLVATGIIPHRALVAAWTFTMVGSDDGEPTRYPGELYPPNLKAFTALALYHNGSSTIFPVSQFDDGVTLIDIFFPSGAVGMMTSNGRHEGVTLLLLDPIFQRVDNALDALRRDPG